MRIYDVELMNSEYITVDEKGWHISDDAPEELKKKFNEFISKAEADVIDETIGFSIHLCTHVHG